MKIDAADVGVMLAVAIFAAPPTLETGKDTCPDPNCSRR